MKKILIGFVMGLLFAAIVGLLLMCTGERFEAMTLKYGVEDNRGIVATDKFVVLYEGIKEDDAGATRITYKGKYGKIPALWEGYAGGFSAGSKGIDTLHTYNPNRGIATLYYFNRIILVQNNGRELRVQNTLFELGDKKIVVLVNKDGVCESISTARAQQLYEKIDGWFKDGEISARAICPQK